MADDINGVVKELIVYVDERIDLLEAEDEEIEERYEEGFDPMDWSGGNFDDAYHLGNEDGEVSGELRVLYRVKSILEQGVE